MQGSGRRLLWTRSQAEIEKVKQRREQRAAERAQQEEELSLIARQRAEAEGLEAEAKEEEVRSALAASRHPSPASLMHPCMGGVPARMLLRLPTCCKALQHRLVRPSQRQPALQPHPSQHLGLQVAWRPCCTWAT